MKKGQIILIFISAVLLTFAVLLWIEEADRIKDKPKEKTVTMNEKTVTIDGEYYMVLIQSSYCRGMINGLKYPEIDQQQQSEGLWKKDSLRYVEVFNSLTK